MTRTTHSAMLRALGIFLIGLAAGIAGLAMWQSSAPTAASPDVDSTGLAAVLNVPARNAIVALGTIEPRDGVVQIGSSLIGYRVAKFHVAEGQLVKTGELLIDLDAAPAKAELELALSQQADAKQRQQAEIELDKQRVATTEMAARQAAEGRDVELEAQRSRMSVAAARKKQAERDLKRFTELNKLPEPLASDQQVEQQRLLLESAAAELEAGAAALKRLDQSLTFQQQTADAELKAAQQALALAEKGTGLESLARQVEIAELKLAQTKIAAPSAGIVMGVLAHAGEVVTQQPLMQIADLDRLVCVAEVDAGDVRSLQPNQQATIKCRAFQESAIEGTVDRIGNQVTVARLRPLDPRRPVDRDVIQVVVQIDSSKAARMINLPGRDRRAALVGLQVDVTFPLADQGKPAP